MTNKAKILLSLQKKYGNASFSYRDILIQALLVTNRIQNESEYDWRVDRGFYSDAISNSNSYLYQKCKHTQLKLKRVKNYWCRKPELYTIDYYVE